jgi:FkbM family methyltransferase
MSNVQKTVWKALRRVKWQFDPILDRCGYKLERKKGEAGPTFLSQLLVDRLESGQDITFVQIGANDGVSTDPLYPLIKKYPGRFRGLVVEPLKDKFDLLKRNYAQSPSVTPVNVAIHNTETEMLIYRVRPDLERTLPAWARGIGSFNPEHHKLSELDSTCMTTENVVCKTFMQLLDEHAISDIDLLVTDTEGYDFELIRGIDFQRYRPACVHFEHGLSSGVMSWERYKWLIRHLAQYGYSISHESSDATAFLPAALTGPALA